MKYEWDEETNMLKLDRVLHGAAFYPHDYGFIPQTLCGDGDPLVGWKLNKKTLGVSIFFALQVSWWSYVIFYYMRLACVFVGGEGSPRTIQ